MEISTKAALHNIQILCPPFATILLNTYRAATELFVQDAIIFSREGTTQGDPLAMPMYALGILPLIQRTTGDILQVWYADDASATGTIHYLREWWEKITTIGPSYSYYANATKTGLVVKDAHLASTTSAFLGTNVSITIEGRPHLGAPLGTETYVAQSIQKVVPTTADLMFNCNHSTTCDLCSLHSQCGSPMDLPSQDRSKHKHVFYPH